MVRPLLAAPSVNGLTKTRGIACFGFGALLMKRSGVSLSQCVVGLPDYEFL